MTRIADQQSTYPTARFRTVHMHTLMQEWLRLQRYYLRHHTLHRLVSFPSTHTPLVRTDERSQRQRGAFAIFTYEQDAEKRYLLRWNKNWNMFNLIGGKMDNARGDNNDFERTIRRELIEEVGLRSRGGSLLVDEIGQLCMRQYSYREKRVKDYHFAIFSVQAVAFNTPMQQRLLRDLPCMRDNVLVTADEIEQLITLDERPISSTTRHILRALAELPDTG